MTPDEALDSDPDDGCLCEDGYNCGCCCPSCCTCEGEEEGDSGGASLFVEP